MSDRPCNLQTHMARLRETRKRGQRLTVRQREDGRTVDRWIDDRWVGAYGALPAPQHCAAFGGECEC